MCYMRMDNEWTPSANELFYTTSSSTAELLGLPATVSEKLCALDDGLLPDSWGCVSYPFANGPVLQNHV